MKSIEMIQMEGCFRIRKIFTSRSVIPNEVNTDIYGSGDDFANMPRVEPVPKNFEYQHFVDRVNQVLSADIVTGYVN